MRKTRINLWTAFMDEAKANRLYLAYAQKAKEEGHPEVAKIFEEVAESETQHAFNHLKVLGEIRSTAENLKKVVETESFEGLTMYPRMIQEAQQEKQPEAAESFRIALEEENKHAQIFEKALKTLPGNIKTEASPIPSKPMFSLSSSATTVELLQEKLRIAALERIREVVFGIQDGLISTLAVASATMLATHSKLVTLIAGFTSALAGVISMSTGTYLASKSENELHQAEIEKERQELKTNPEEESAELIEIYRHEGFSFEEARRLAERVASDPDLWLKTMAEKELGLPLELSRGENPSWDAATMGVSFFLGSLIALGPYFFLIGKRAVQISIFLSLCTLLGVGMLKTKITRKNPLRSGLEMLLIGSLSAALGYLIGELLPRKLGIL